MLFRNSVQAIDGPARCARGRNRFRRAIALAAIAVVCGGGCGKMPWSSGTGDAGAATHVDSRPPSYHGHVDRVDAKGVFGWACDENHPDEVVSVDIYDGNTLLATVAADRDRADLKSKGRYGAGKHGIGYRWAGSVKDRVVVNLPGHDLDVLRPDKRNSIVVKFSGTDQKLMAKVSVVGPSK